MKKFVFACTTAAIAIFSSPLFAKGPNNPANFEAAKAQMSQMADKRMSIIKDFKACVDAAADINALKECKSKEASAMKEIRPNRMPRGGGGMPMNDGNGSQRGPRSMM